MTKKAFMAISNRADRIAHVYKILKKHYQPVAAPQRTVLEHLLYACCLDGVSYDKADVAFQRIQEISIDWNEVRVTSAAEIAESMVGFPEPRRSAANLRRVLQSVFESQYSFDLEHLKKQNLGKTIKELEKHSGTSPFVVSYVTQHALGGHSIPVDRGALDVMYISEVIDEKEREAGTVPGLERAIPKKQGIEFGSLLHQIAAELVATPFSPAVRATLLEINPQGKDRLPKRKSRKKPAAAKKSEESAKPKLEAPPEVKKTAKKKPAPGKQPPVAKKSPSKKTAKSPPKKTTKKPAAKTGKKSPTKQLSKRKPR